MVTDELRGNERINGACWEWSQREAVRHRWVTRTGELAGVSESTRAINCKTRAARVSERGTERLNAFGV